MTSDERRQVMRKALSGLAAVAVAASAATLAHAGVRPDGPPLRAPAKLDCPARSGDLTRTAQSPDGQWCDYAGQHGETVRLRLTPLNGQTPSEAMAPVRAQLHSLVPVYRTATPVNYSTGDSADVDVPFVHVHKNGDKADVRLFGIFHIVGHDHDSDFDKDHGQEHATVHAGLRGAEVVADKIGRRNASLVYVLAGNHRYASGYRAAGYVAKGPVTGPLVVAEFRSPVNSHRDNDDGHMDLDRLIDRQLDR